MIAKLLMFLSLSVGGDYEADHRMDERQRDSRLIRVYALMLVERVIEFVEVIAIGREWVCVIAKAPSGSVRKSRLPLPRTIVYAINRTTYLKIQVHVSLMPCSWPLHSKGNTHCLVANHLGMTVY